MLQCFSLEFHFRNANALGPDTVIYLLIYLCTYLPVPLCLPVAHSSLLSASMSPVGPRTPPLAPLCPLCTLLCTCIHTKYTHVQTEGEKNQLGSLLQGLMLPSPCFCQLWGPIIQSVHDHAPRSVHREHQQSVLCLCWFQSAAVVRYWKP